MRLPLFYASSRCHRAFQARTSVLPQAKSRNRRALPADLSSMKGDPKRFGVWGLKKQENFADEIAKMVKG